MTKTIAILFGIVYAFLGILGLFDTGIVGMNGFFAADGAYGLACMVIGSLLLIGAVTEHARSANLVIGVVLALAALAGFLIAPDKGQMFGMLVNLADHAANLVLGLVLAGIALLEHAPHPVPRSRSIYRRYARNA